MPQESLSATPVALTVELELAAVRAGQQPPEPLSRDQAGQLADAIAGDLARILGTNVHDCGLILPAALYDLTELMQPGLPWVEVLLELYRGSFAGKGFMPHVIGIGGNRPFPVPALAPRRQPGAGPLLLLPMLLVGERKTIDEAQQRLEEVLLEKGQAGAATEQILRLSFGIEPVNLAYATFNDLSALLKIQLGHAGLDGLWRLLETALFRPGQTEEVRLAEKNVFVGRDNNVYTLFYTFDEWLADAAGDADSYSRWLRMQRLYEAGVAAHGLTVRRLRHVAQLEAGCGGRLGRLAEQHEIGGDVLREPDDSIPPLEGASVVFLTEQATRELGPFAYTVLVQASDGRVLHMSNEYPLTAEAARNVREGWASTAAELGLALQLSQTGEMTTSEDGRHLMPLTDFDDTTH